MVLRKLAVALLSVGVMLPGLGHALAVSDLQTKSALGEPFWGEVDLSEINDLNADEIKVSLASQEDFERVGVERTYFLTDLKFDVIVNPAGRSYVKITTVKPVREPYLDFVVRVAWPGNASLRELTALLDPPVSPADVSPADINQAVSSSPAAVTEAPVVAPVAEAAPVEPAPEAGVAAVAPADNASPPAPAPVLKPAPVAQAPKRQPAAPAPVPAPSVLADSYRTQSGDTMSKIAAQFRPADASSAQTMVAIQRANPSAFGNDNINQLKRGQVLRIPSESEIREVSAKEAIASVRDQSEAWRSALVSAPAKPALEAQQVDATAKAEVKAPAAPSEVKPEMKLLGAQAGKSGAAAAGKEQGAAAKPGDTKKLDENKARLEAAKAEKDKLNAKVSTLDSQVQANDKKLDVQNAKLAELQAQMKEQEARKAAAAAPSAPVPAPATAPAPTTAAAPASEPAPTATPEAVQTQAAAPAAPIESKPLPPAAPVVAEEAPAAEGLPIPLIGGGLAALLAVVGGFWWSQKRKREQAEEAAALAELEAMEDMSAAGSDGSESLFLGGSPAQAEQPAASAEDDAWLGEFETTDSASAANDRVLADPLEEVEQYLAFERYPQAVGFLNKAISGSPQRADLRLKLLEVYARLDDWNGFTEQEAWFENAGDLSALAHAEELKAGMTPPARKASPDDPLHYAPAAPVAAVAASAAADDLPSLEDLEMDFNATVSASSPALQAVQDSDLSLDLPDLDGDFALETPELDLAPVKAADSGLSLDEDLDFSYSEPVAKAPAAADDLSFELDDAAFESSSSRSEPMTTAADEALDFSLDESFDAPASAAGKSSLGELVDFDSAPEIKAVDPDNSLVEDDLSFSLDDLETASAPAADLEGDFSLDDGKATDIGFDDTLQADSGLNDAAADFDSTLRADAAPAVAAAAPVAAAADLGMDDEFDFLADTDENATKLDLARAYIDMGDMDGARDILQEVLTEGNGNQKDEAKGLLAQVG